MCPEHCVQRLDLSLLTATKVRDGALDRQCFQHRRFFRDGDGFRAAGIQIEVLRPFQIPDNAIHVRARERYAAQERE